MGVLALVNHFGTFLLFLAMVLLIVSSITAPTVNSLSLFSVNLGSDSGDISFGTFGYCVHDVRGRGCSRTSIGYSPTSILREVDGTDFSDWTESTSKALTNVMILHPIGAGIAFVGFALSLGSSFFGSFLSSLVAGITFVVTVAALACDFVWMDLVRRRINRRDNGGNPDSHAYYDAALWCVLASAICSLLATIILFFTCCTGRVNRKRAERRKADYHSPPAVAHTRHHWWQRR
ncbi:hypothetical protein VD0002_g5495 [Verticillium dahliae]|uniref:PH-response regulator protein palI/RIM9 n=2 Tax=Verticillium dahliae TaxID=27337 RepID=G2WR46_VERDV|nr:uncharacterized protein VDAG_00029 [Verticillium dahliae VdLs.17]KAF3345265.1 hypothetical protein VdG2_06516 [Verticillium dahliae VDG2]KAH6709787.1 SUR7/PalI family-domain-containing protein [Verticillium dahliae]EGY13347.1 hypothetical protein VDAG_00029 [Verticillium dahliae VdLs.17]PNH29572.1 hypothetical protein BJF96_g7029 [Verticillium dahliae]PNH40765.1 hypothetical protein VD0004_g6271 [Verticillium dahliae]